MEEILNKKITKYYILSINPKAQLEWNGEGRAC
jgi:hypothetical protein